MLNYVFERFWYAMSTLDTVQAIVTTLYGTLNKVTLDIPYITYSLYDALEWPSLDKIFSSVS